MPFDSGWTFRRQSIGVPDGEKVLVFAGDWVLTFADVLAAWQDDERFRDAFTAALAATPAAGFFWEMPPIRRGALDREFEYVTIGSRAFERLDADPTAFQAKLAALDEAVSVASFLNLGGDARLVVPRLIAETTAYGHVAAFLRSAPRAQQHELFRVLAEAISTTLDGSSAPLWVSTSGLGVPWVHLRLDARPKYYSYQPYRSTAA